jgi:nitrogen fixation protein FixH
MQNYNLLYTLGGGSLLAFIAFFVFYKLIRLPGKVAALATAAFMLVLYVPLAAMHWPGLDTFAIHFAFFMMIAYGLGMITGIRAERFKREGKDGEKQGWFHWGPAIIVIFFLTVATVDAIIITLATKGLDGKWADLILPEQQTLVKRLDDESRELQALRNKDRLDDEFKAFYMDDESVGESTQSKFPGTVAYNLQKREADYNQQMARLKAQKERGWQLDGGWEKPAEQNKTAVFEIKMFDKAGEPLPGATVDVGFLRPSDKSKDVHVTFDEVDKGVYRKEVVLTEPGLWTVDIKVTKGEDTHEVVGKTSVIPEGR